MGDKAIEFLEKHLSPQAFGLFLLCGCAIYIWFQHLRNKLLKEQIEFEKDKRESFLKELQELKNAPPSKSSAPVKDFTSRHILVVDDEPFLRDMLIEGLSKHYPDIQIDEASDGVEALEVFKLNEPSVLITDAMMPRLTGFELINRLQQQGKTVPTLMISGYVTSNSFGKMLSAAKIRKNKNLMFLSKPFNFDEFINAVDTLLKR